MLTVLPSDSRLPARLAALFDPQKTGPVPHALPRGLLGPPAAPFTLPTAPLHMGEWYSYARYSATGRLCDLDPRARPRLCCGKLLREVLWPLALARPAERTPHSNGRNLECRWRLAASAREEHRAVLRRFIAPCTLLRAAWLARPDALFRPEAGAAAAAVATAVVRPSIQSIQGGSSFNPSVAASQYLPLEALHQKGSADRRRAAAGEAVARLPAEFVDAAANLSTAPFRCWSIDLHTTCGRLSHMQSGDESDAPWSQLQMRRGAAMGNDVIVE